MFREEGGKTYALPSCADPFFQKYLDVFDKVRVLGIPVRDYLDTSALVKMTDPRISVRIAKPNTAPAVPAILSISTCVLLINCSFHCV